MNIRRDLWPILKETFSSFQNDDAGQLGAALAYYAMFSIFPLLLLLLALLGFVLDSWETTVGGQAISAHEAIIAAVSKNFSPNLSENLAEALETLQDQAGAATGVGVVLLLLGASGVFQQLDSSFNKIWQTKIKQDAWRDMIRTTLLSKLFSFGMVLAVGFLLLVSLALTGLTQALLSVMADIPFIGGAVGFILGLLITLALNTAIFALLFKYLPNTHVRWANVWIGAIATAIIWEIAKRLLALYIEHSSYASAYGAVGTMLVLMIWIYFSAQVLFLGAEFTKVYTLFNDKSLE